MPIHIRIKNKGLFYELIKYHVIFYTFCSISVCPHVNSYKVTKVMTDFSLGLYNNPKEKEKILDGLKTNISSNLKNNYCKCYESVFENYDEFDIKYVEATCHIGENDVKISYSIHYSISSKDNESIFPIEHTINKKVYNKLNINNAQEEPDKKLLSKLVLIYGMLGFETGQFWGLHPNFYKKIESSYENPMECFASPFNHNLQKYYSPVPKIDKHFGSKGNFFKKFLKSKNDCYVMNPPFVEDIMKNVFKMSLNKFSSSEKEITIFYYLPYWKDMIDPFIQELKHNDHYCKHHVFYRNKTFVYDYINDKKYPNASFELVLIQAATKSNVTCNDGIFSDLLKTLEY